MDHAAEQGSQSEIIIELGSGMGTVGFAAAEALRRLQEIRSSNRQLVPGIGPDVDAPKKDLPAEKRMRSANVILTDLPDVCTLLRENVSVQLEEWKRAGLSDGFTAVDCGELRHNEEETVGLCVRKLSWGNQENIENLSMELKAFSQSSEKRDGDNNLIILCSDLVYFPHLLAPLLRTLIYLTSPTFVPNASAHATIIMSYRLRSFAKETPFWRAFGTWFSFHPVLERQALAETEWRRVGWQESALSFIFVARRKPESLSWKCPERDDELMNTFGGDDTFEILLMLCNDAAEG